MKRLITIITIIVLLLGSIPAFAEDSPNLTYDQAKTNLFKYNFTVKKMQNEERQAYLKYKNAVDQTQAINPKGFTYEGVFIDFDLYTRILLTEKKELLPEQMKNAWEIAKENCKLTENSLFISLRDVYLDLVTSCNALQIEESKVKLAEKIWKADKGKLSKGLITVEDADSSDYNFLKAKEDRMAAVGNKENSVRSFNSYVGLPVENIYGNIEYKETANKDKVESLDFYIGKALLQRQEILSIQRETAAKEHQLKIIEEDKAYVSYPDAVKERSDVLFDIEMLDPKLDKVKYDITKEIKNAYIEVMKQNGNIKSQKNLLDMQKRNYQKVAAQYKKGMVTAASVDELQIKLKQAENEYYYAIFRYNTTRMKLEYASRIGPGYSDENYKN